MTGGLDNPLHGVLTIARLTWLEARRTRMALAALVCAVLFLTAYGLAVFFLFPTQSAEVTRPLPLRQAQLEILILVGLYAMAFIGGWIEEIGFMLGNEPARYIGTAISLLSPVDAMWRLACHEMQPPLMQQLRMSPFSTAAVPSGAMVVWAMGFVVAALVLALRRFSTRAL